MPETIDFQDMLANVAEDEINTEFRSTRGEGMPNEDDELSQEFWDFWESVNIGKDKNGGLLMPNQLPKFSDEFINNLDKLSPAEISAYLNRYFIPREEIDDERLLGMMEIAHNFDLPLEFLEDNTFILRLDQGPTASFKDNAARDLRQKMQAHCEKFGTKLNLIVATSGDTGVAIMNAFGDSPDITVTVMYPTDGVSPPQEKQMLDTKNKFKNTQVIPIDGNFDNCQDISILLQLVKNLEKKNENELPEAIQEIIKQAKIKLEQVLTVEDVEGVRKLLEGINLGSANSQNIWRLIPQMKQYFVGIGEMLKNKHLEQGEKVVYAVPSGNVGHLTAGILAMEGGAPIKKFLVGTNSNNILAGLINRGEIQHPGFQNTSSPSMDIGDPNNFERILDYAAQKIGFEGKIDYQRMKDDITKLDIKISNVRKEIKEMEKTGEDVEKVDAVREELIKLLKKTIKLKDYGMMPEIIEYLQGFIHVEDVTSDSEVYASIERTSTVQDVVMEPHGITAKVATDRAREKGIIGENDKVIILETAHPDKFPEALDASGVMVAHDKKHPELQRLESMNVEDLDKPEAFDKDLIAVAKKVRELALSQIEG